MGCSCLSCGIKSRASCSPSEFPFHRTGKAPKDNQDRAECPKCDGSRAQWDPIMLEQRGLSVADVGLAVFLHENPAHTETRLGQLPNVGQHEDFERGPQIGVWSSYERLSA